MLKHTIVFAVIAGLVFALAPASIASAGDYSDAVLDLNPINYWRLEEGSGTAADLGSNNVSGTYQVDVTGMAGPRPTDTVGGFALTGFESDNIAASVDHISEHGQVVTSGYTPVSGSDARTIVAWINPSSYSDHPWEGHVVVGYGGGSAWQGLRFGLGYPSEPDRLQVNFGHGGSKVYSTTETIPLDQWSFVAFSIPDGAAITDTSLYINGQPVTATYPSPDTINTVAGTPLAIGEFSPGEFGQRFDGVIDEVAIFDYELSEQQMADLFDAATAIGAVPGDLDGDDGDVDLDDVAVFENQFGSQPHAPGPPYTADFDEDDDVDLDDFLVMRNNFGTGVSAPEGGATIPEPATMTVLALGGLMVLRRRRS